jgi:peptidoglycan/xylan/chitin deacetylase (PgdA/CDA1 family)
MVLAALKAECLQATFFPIGTHATWHPEVLKQVIAGGTTVGFGASFLEAWSSKSLPGLNLSSKPLIRIRWIMEYIPN